MAGHVPDGQAPRPTAWPGRRRGSAQSGRARQPALPTLAGPLLRGDRQHRGRRRGGSCGLALQPAERDDGRGQLRRAACELSLTVVRSDGINCGMNAVSHGEPDKAVLDRLRARLQSYMVKKGLRSTAQRRLIIDTFFEGVPHMTIEDLLTEVRARDRGIGYATVYRTLKLLAECGVASERRFGDGLSRYALADDG